MNKSFKELLLKPEYNFFTLLLYGHIIYFLNTWKITILEYIIGAIIFIILVVINFHFRNKYYKIIEK